MSAGPPPRGGSWQYTSTAPACFARKKNPKKKHGFPLLPLLLACLLLLLVVVVHSSGGGGDVVAVVIFSLEQEEK